MAKRAVEKNKARREMFDRILGERPPENVP